MFTAAGYATDRRIHESATSIIYGAVREADRRPVVLKVLADSHPAPEAIARFKREYVVLRELAAPGVIEALDYIRTADHWAIVEEDFGGSSLARLELAGQIGIERFLELAIAIAGIVATVHSRRVIHKDINPSNIVLHPATGVIKLIDFGISASRLAEETVGFEHPALLEGTPAYLSPEQTGRINRALDERSDLYSLGCTFYQLLTGQLPFATGDILELVHCHLARAPRSPGELRPEIPASLSAVVLKLMAKNPDERYQSAHGLRADLVACLEIWRGPRTTRFALGHEDVTSRFRLPARLYGRDAEITGLLDAYERVSRGETGLVLVTGHSGIGKSAVVRELYAPITRNRGLFAAGKFGQYERNIPHAAFVEAFHVLVQQLLCEGEAQIASRRDQLLRAVGPSCAVLTDVIPQLELITGPLPPPPALPAGDAHQRFLRATCEFVRACARAEHPLVLFLDDLQWADSASLELVRTLTTAERVPHLLLVAAYRDSEVGPGHPLRLLVDNLEIAHRLHLAPLGPADVTRLLGDALRVPDDRAESLAALVHARTGGNPFYIAEFVKALHADDLIGFDHEAGVWGWDMERVRARDISANVVELLLDKLGRLAPAARLLLQWAACIGDRFDLRTLLAVAGLRATEVVTELIPAITEGFVLPMTGDYRLFEAGIADIEQRVDVEYRFAHDRIQQAVYTSISEPERRPMHLHIGRQLAVDAAPRGRLKAASQLDLAEPLVGDHAERLAIARLNLEAGDLARSAAAHQAALQFFLTGLAFLSPPGASAIGRPDRAAVGPDAFAADYSLCLTLTGRAAESAYLVADFAAMERLAVSALAHARSWQDKVEIYQIRINALTAQDRLLDAIDAAREILGPLGVSLPHAPEQSDVDQAIREVDRALAGSSFESLLEAPPAAADAAHRGALRILDSIHTTTVMALQALGPIVAARMVQLTIEHGRTDESIGGCIYHGIQLCGQGRIAEGYLLARLARQLCIEERRSAQLAELSSNGYYHVFHWKEPLRALAADMSAGHRAAWDAGQVALAANCLVNTTVAPFIAGAELGPLAGRMGEVVRIVEDLKQGPYALWLRVYRQCALNLIHPGDDPTALRGEAYDEDQLMPVHLSAHAALTIQLVHLLKVMLGYRFDRPRVAVASYLQYVHGKYPRSGVLLPATTMYYCLAQLALCSESTGEQRAAVLDEVRARLGQLKEWADHGPMNYAHKYHLVEAELARVLGENSRAREHYDLAIDLARANQYLNEESLALERAALFYRERGQTRLAGYYMRDALYAYQRWGAEARVQQLRDRHPELLAAGVPAAPRRSGDDHTTAAVPDLDLQAVVRASRAIGAEREPSALLQRIMSICLEYAGARRGFLILVRADELIVKARGEIRDRTEIEVISEALDDQDGLSHGIVRYVARTSEAVVLDDAVADGPFTNDPHVRSQACRSVLCLPILSQGALVALAYMENHTTAGAFRADRLEILGLVTAQAAVSIENALLRSAGEGESFQYEVGGSLAVNTPSYVERQADRVLVERIDQGELCYVFNARQMGKSSLRVHIMDRLVRRGFCCAAVDLTSIGSETLSAEQWYAGVARAVLSGLGLGREVDLRTWWRERSFLPPPQRLFELFDTEVLERIARPIVIFIDEIDMVLGRAFSLDDFFALIRSFHNRRADDPRYERLRFVLIGVATPTELIRDRTRTPFNIGQAVPLTGFRFAEARTLARGLTGFGQPELVLQAILTWTGGQPFLTQKLCQLARVAESRPPPDKEREWVASLVRQRVIDKWRMHDEPEHLKTVEARILRSPNRPALLELYREILDQGGVAGRETAVEAELALSGLVVPEWGRLRPGNLIYASVFNAGWIREASAG